MTVSPYIYIQTRAHSRATNGLRRELVHRFAHARTDIFGGLLSDARVSRFLTFCCVYIRRCALLAGGMQSRLGAPAHLPRVARMHGFFSCAEATAAGAKIIYVPRAGLFVGIPAARAAYILYLLSRR